MVWRIISGGIAAEIKLSGDLDEAAGVAMLERWYTI